MSRIRPRIRTNALRNENFALAAEVEVSGRDWGVPFAEDRMRCPRELVVVPSGDEY